MNKQLLKTKTNVKTISPDVFGVILEEIRLLRNEVSLLLPNENLEDYAHPDRIKNSHQNAIKKYPPVTL